MKAVAVRDDVRWGALAAAFLVAQQVMAKATRDALFLSHHPARTLPWAMMASALLAVAAALGIGRLLVARAPRQVVPALVGINAGLLLCAFLVALSAPRLAAVLVYLLIAASGGTLLSGFWSVVNERFDPWTAKRVIGRLGLGSTLGGVAGGALSYAAAGVVPVTTMLPLTAAAGVAALVCLVRFGGEAPAARPRETLAPARGLRDIPYLQLLALLVATGAFVEALLDYVLKARAAALLAPGPSLMAFFAAYHTGVGLLALAGQTLLARRALQTLGLAGTVALRPLLVGVAAAGGLVDGRLWSGVLGRGSHDVLSNSLFRSGYELLYTPLPEREKRATKQVVDVVFDKLGSLLGGAAALLAVRVASTPERALLWLVVGLSLLTLGLTRRLHRGYVATLEEALRAGKIRLTADEVEDSTTSLTLTRIQMLHRDQGPRTAPGSVADALAESIADLRSGDAARIRRVLAVPPHPELVAHLIPLIARNDVYLLVLQALRQQATRATGALVDALLDDTCDPSVRRRLPRVFKAAPSARAVEGLLWGIADPRFDVRAACAAALCGITARTPLPVPEGAVVAAVLHELEEANSADAVPHDAQLAHVFALLSLLLEREPLRIAERALRGADAALRGTALEYLETVLPRELRGPTLRYIGAPASGGTRARAELLTDLLRARPRSRRALKPPD